MFEIGKSLIGVLQTNIERNTFGLAHTKVNIFLICSHEFISRILASFEQYKVYNYFRFRSKSLPSVPQTNTKLNQGFF